MNSSGGQPNEQGWYRLDAPGLPCPVEVELKWDEDERILFIHKSNATAVLGLIVGNTERHHQAYIWEAKVDMFKAEWESFEEKARNQQPSRPIER